MRVVKFGGSSLADSKQFEKVVAIMQADPQRQVVVTSAPGKREHGDIKVTDLLIRYCQQVQAHAEFSDTVAEIVSRYAEIAEHYQLAAGVLGHIQAELESLATEQFPDADYQMAAFKAHGEKLNGYLLTAVLNAAGSHAVYGEPKTIGWWYRMYPMMLKSKMKLMRTWPNLIGLMGSWWYQDFMVILKPDALPPFLAVGRISLGRF